MEKVVEQFRARAADGRLVDIVKYVDVLEADPTSGGPEHEPVGALPAFRTADGREVNHVAGNEYEVLEGPEPFIVLRI